MTQFLKYHFHCIKTFKCNSSTVSVYSACTDAFYFWSKNHKQCLQSPDFAKFCVAMGTPLRVARVSLLEIVFRVPAGQLPVMGGGTVGGLGGAPMNFSQIYPYRTPQLSSFHNPPSGEISAQPGNRSVFFRNINIFRKSLRTCVIAVFHSDIIFKKYTNQENLKNRKTYKQENRTGQQGQSPSFVKWVASDFKTVMKTIFSSRSKPFTDNLWEELFKSLQIFYEN